MATQMKTPGVYIKELDAFGNAVVAVPTAIPAFIGYTEMAAANGDSLIGVPTKINSLMEYETYFGRGDYPIFDFADMGSDPTAGNFHTGGESYSIERDADSIAYMMYPSIQLFYANGGGEAIITSVGGYHEATGIDAGVLTDAIKLLEKEPDPTMVVIPDTVSLAKNSDCYGVQAQMITHCADMMSRFAILDIYDGYEGLDGPGDSVIDDFRNGLTIGQPDNLQFGAAYYPWLNTSVYNANNVSFMNFKDAGTGTSASLTAVAMMIEDELGIAETASTPNQQAQLDMVNQMLDFISPQPPDTDALKQQATDIDQSLTVMSPSYAKLKDKMAAILSLLPVSAAMAGVYTSTDNSRGVWKAPANVGVMDAINPNVEIDNAQQEDLNVPVQGRAVNAIRSFVGQGTLVWGARTLLGNSNDWRYINVRRTLIFLEQSIKAAAQAFVFEPNTPNTWTTVKSMIENFLNNQWKAGAIVGSSPEAAYQVSIGLGATMTQDDINNGIMRITVLVAPSRPAEFIEITFQQKQQE